jgi:hypothetical protein
MQAPSSTHPPKPADRPGGSWVLTRFRPSGCANSGMLHVCRQREPVFRWVFVRDGDALDVREPLSFGRM